MTIEIKAAIKAAITDVKAKRTNPASGRFEIRVHAGAECYRRRIRSILLGFQKIHIDICFLFRTLFSARTKPAPEN